MLRRSILRSFTGALLGALVALPSPADAAPPPADATPARTAAAAPTPAAVAPNEAVTLVVHAPDGAVERSALRDAVATELGVSVSLADAPPPDAHRLLTVSVTPDTHELAVSYAEPGRAAVSRVVTAPDAPAARLELAVHLAGNLARRQTDDLLPAAPAAAAPPAPPALPTTPPPERILPATAALFFPAATNFDAPNAATRFDFNVAYGRVGRLQGAGFGTVSVASGRAEGMRASWMLNYAGGSAQGLELSWGANVAGRLEGAQSAFVANVVKGGARGAQIAGVNVSGPLEGTQIGAVNVAGDAEGLQLGAFNVAKRVHGMQLGFVNVADDVDGVPLGLISVTKTGGVHPVVWSSATTYGNLGLKFATRYTYTMIHGGVHVDAGRALGGPGFTVGGRIPLDPLVVEIDLQGLHLFGDALCCSDARALRQHDQTQAKVRASVGYHVAPHFTLFAGGGATGIVRYPPTGTQVTVDVVPDVFGGIEL
jgi:hypothetical protein